MDLSDALDFARARRNCVLVTQRSNGRPQLSNVNYHAGDNGVIRISITADRAKYKNLSREPWAAVHVTSDDFWRYAVIEGDASLSAVAAAPDDAAVEELVELYRAIAGEHDDWDDYRRAMVADKRVVARISPTRAYGAV
ncbi:MAG: PPOX class F420-dependent oxidoreductase [Jatrophihabitantaceae bacterium]